MRAFFDLAKKVFPRYNQGMKRLLPSTLTLFSSGVFLAILGLGTRLFSLDGDLGRHITIGAYILQHHIIPLQDVFSHTMAGQPLVPHEWLAQVLFAFSHRWLGLGGAVWLTALVIAAAFAVALQDAAGRRKTPAPLLLTVLGFALALASSVHWLARPHIFTLLLAALWAWHVEQAWQQPKKASLWRTALLMLLWVNLHGAFITAFVIGGAYLAEALMQKDPLRLKMLLQHGLLALATTLFNPAGWHIWEVVFGFLGNRYLVTHTHEYQPPNFQQAGFWPFLLLIGLLLFLTARRKQPLPLRYTLLLTGWTLLGLYSARNIAIWAVLALPILGDWLEPLPAFWAGREAGLQRLGAGIRFQAGWILLGLAAAGGLLAQPSIQSMMQYPPERFPVQAVDWLEVHPQEGNLFNYFDWGGYLLYRLWPQQRVFIDGQTDFYGEALTREYATVITATNGWENVLARYRVRWVLIPPDTPLARVLEDSSDWQQAWRDETAVIYVQK